MDISATWRDLLQAFDPHMNLILGDVEETITLTEVDPETDEQLVKVRVTVSLMRVCGLTMHRP